MSTLSQILIGATSVGCCSMGAYMAFKDKKGWGWFLFIGILALGMLNE